MVTEEKHCRVCEGDLDLILDLGEMYPSNFVSNEDNLFKAPLTLVRCTNCGLVQLKHTVDLDRMYRQYWYKSSLNQSMIDALKDVVENIEAIIKLDPGDIVLDIGCNDGVMFTHYQEKLLNPIGFDPALNLKDEAEQRCTFINNYFNKDEYLKVTSEKAKVITSIAMFYDLPDPNTFVKDVVEVLDPEGLWVIQFTDLYAMLSVTAFDNICHEHLEYYSLSWLNKFLKGHGLRIFKVQRNNVNGASLRIFVDFGVRDVDKSVDGFILQELQYMAQFEDPFKAFADRVEKYKETLVRFLTKASRNKNKVCVLGASTKGNTLLQYYGLDNTVIKCAFEVNPDKFGLETVGTHIPIVSEEEFEKERPEYLLVLPWHFMQFFYNKFIAKRLRYDLTFVVPLPEPYLINSKGYKLL